MKPKKRHAKRGKKGTEKNSKVRQQRSKSVNSKNQSRTSSKGKRKKDTKPVSKVVKLDKRRKVQSVTKRKRVKVIRRKDSGKSVSLKHNVLTIYLTGLTTFEDKLNYVRELDFSEQVQRFIDQFEDKFPRAFMVVFESGEQYFANKMSPPEMNVDYENVKKFVLDTMIEFQDTFFIEGTSDIEFDYNATFDPNLIERIRIRFFYG